MLHVSRCVFIRVHACIREVYCFVAPEGLFVSLVQTFQGFLTNKKDGCKHTFSLLNLQNNDIFMPTLVGAEDEHQLDINVTMIEVAEVATGRKNHGIILTNCVLLHVGLQSVHESGNVPQNNS